MKQLWLRKKECTGCGACENICPVDALQLVPDKFGFIYPVINADCINCNRCEIVCRERGNNNTASNHPKVFAAWSLNQEIRFKSTSGGIFTEIAKQVIDDGGFVAGSGYTEQNLAEHIVISSEEEIDNIRQSKYLQSNISLIYRSIKEKLDCGYDVAFCGAPCQVAGLYSYLRKKYDKLITIDFICRGMNSPKAYLAWLKEIEDCNSKKIIKVWFKYKENGWKESPFCTRLDFDDGTYQVVDRKENVYMKGYLESNLYIRPSCGKCKFKGVPRQADISLADFWGVDKELDDDKGTSIVMLNSQKGEKMFERLKKNIFFTERSFNEVVMGNICAEHSVDINIFSKKFLLSLDEMKFSDAIDKYSHPSILIKVIGKIRRKLLLIWNKT